MNVCPPGAANGGAAIYYGFWPEASMYGYGVDPWKTFRFVALYWIMWFVAAGGDWLCTILCRSQGALWIYRFGCTGYAWGTGIVSVVCIGFGN